MNALHRMVYKSLVIDNTDSLKLTAGEMAGDRLCDRGFLRDAENLHSR